MIQAEVAAVRVAAVAVEGVSRGSTDTHNRDLFNDRIWMVRKDRPILRLI